MSMFVCVTGYGDDDEARERLCGHFGRLWGAVLVQSVPLGERVFYSIFVCWGAQKINFSSARPNYHGGPRLAAPLRGAAAARARGAG